MRTPEEAYAYLTTLRHILLYTGLQLLPYGIRLIALDATYMSARPWLKRVRNKGPK